MVFKKKKKEQKAELIEANEEEKQEKVDPQVKANVKEFNAMVNKYGLLTPENFPDQKTATQSNLLFAIYMEIKGLREEIQSMQDE